jgi:urease accessory protein
MLIFTGYTPPSHTIIIDGSSSYRTMSSSQQDLDLERHVLYILLDSNLPTGGFVASSGLESYAKHGFFSSPSHLGQQGNTNTRARVQEAVVEFCKRSVMNYAKSTLGFVNDAWTVMDRLASVSLSSDSLSASSSAICERTVEDLNQLDRVYEAMTLNHVTRRSSIAQGIALLTLLTKGFAPPFPDVNVQADETGGDLTERIWWTSAVDGYKSSTRRGESPGHLPVCWGVLTRAMGLSLGKSPNAFLHLLCIHADWKLSRYNPSLTSASVFLPHRTVTPPSSIPTRPIALILRRQVKPHRTLRFDPTVIAFPWEQY